jgi:valacyclovir hydrolase
MGWFEHAESTIHFEDEGKGDPVLFLPGWSESVDEFTALRAALSEKFRVIAADLPGSGKSGPQPRAYTPAYYEDDAQSFLALLEAMNVIPAHILGFSDGGEVALVMAVRNPESPRSVVAWGAAGQLVTPPEMVDAFYSVVDEPIEPLAEFSEHLKGAYGEANARAMSQSVVTAWRSIQDAGGDISRSKAAAIGSPTLLITGEHDFFAPPQVVSELAQMIKGGEFIEVKGAGHVLHHDHGEWLADTIVSWLLRHEA